MNEKRQMTAIAIAQYCLLSFQESKQEERYKIYQRDCIQDTQEMRLRPKTLRAMRVIVLLNGLERNGDGIVQSFSEGNAGGRLAGALQGSVFVLLYY